MEANEESREMGSDVPQEVREPDAPEQEPDVSALTAEVEALRQSEAARAAEVEALRAELAVAQQEQERVLDGLRAELADARRGQLDAHRRAILAEHAGQIVEELIAGNTIAELDASIVTAQAAYGRALENARRELGATIVPVGASPRLAPNPEELSPIAKIAAALNRGR